MIKGSAAPASTVAVEGPTLSASTREERRGILHWSTSSLVVPSLAIGAALFVFHLALVVPNYFFVDDYSIIVQQDARAALRWASLHDLRFSYLGLLQLVSWLGIDLYRSSTTALLLGCIAFGFGATFLLRAWLGERISLFAMLCGLVALVHPFWAELYQFRPAPLIIGLVFLLWTASFYLGERGRVAPGALCLAAALGLYQSAINQAAIAFLMLLLLMLPSIGRPEIQRLRGVALTLLLGVILYGAAATAVSHWSGIEVTGRARWLSPAQIPDRGHQVLQLVRFLFGRADVAFAAPYAKALLAVVIIAVPLAQIRRGRGALKNSGWILAASALTGGSFCFVNLAMLPLSEWWPTARNLVSMGLIWSGLLLYAGRLGERAGPWARGALTTLVCALIVSFNAAGDRFHTDLIRIGVRDAQFANRVAGRIEQIVAGGRLPESVVFVNAPLHYPDMPRYMDLLVPAASTSWSEWSFIEEIVGWPLRAGTESERARAAQYCSAHARWPAPDAVAVQAGIAVVCQ